MSEYWLNCDNCGNIEWVHALSGLCLECKIEEDSK